MFLTHISLPVSASSATTRLYIVARYITPFTTSGVDADCRGAGRVGSTMGTAAPRAGGAGGTAAGAPSPSTGALPRPGVGGTGAGVSYVHASARFDTLRVLICLSGEYRCAPGSCPWFEIGRASCREGV